MGLDAFVRCNCFELGLTKEPPIPREELFVDEDGCISSVKASEAYSTMEYEEYREKFGELDDKLWEWKKECCAHPEMDYCSEWVGNWYAVRFFEGLVEQLGNKESPLLPSIIPNGNGGVFPAEKAPAALDELQRLLSRISEMHQISLVDASTGEQVYSYIAAWGGVFMYALDQQIGLDEHGLFVIELPTGIKAFRSRHLLQQLSAKGQGATLTCLDTGSTCEVFSAIGGNKTDREMKLEVLPVQDYQMITAHALQRLLTASIETCNPIHWC
jgi:hypothetical protein